MGWDRGIFHDSSDSSRFTCCRKYFFEWSLSGILSGILSDKYSSIPSGIYPHVLSNILFGMCSCPCNRRAACRPLWDWSNLETFIWQVGKPLRLILTMAFSRTKFLTFYLTYKHIHTFRPTICRSQFWVVSHASLQVKEISLSDFSLEVHVNGLVEGKFCRTPLLYIYQIYIYIYLMRKSMVSG